MCGLDLFTGPTGGKIGPIVKTRNYTDPRGRITTDKEDAFGNVIERQQMSREDSEAVQNMIKTRAEEVGLARLERQEAIQITEVIARTEDPEARHALRERRDVILQSSRDRMEKLRSEVPPEEWVEYELGRPPEPLA